MFVYENEALWAVISWKRKPTKWYMVISGSEVLYIGFYNYNWNSRKRPIFYLYQIFLLLPIFPLLIFSSIFFPSYLYFFSLFSSTVFFFCSKMPVWDKSKWREFIDIDMDKFFLDTMPQIFIGKIRIFSLNSNNTKTL